MSELWQTGLPEWSFVGGTSSEPSVSQDHEPAQYYESQFKLLDNFFPSDSSLKLPSNILANAGGKKVTWSGGETSIQRLVTSVLTDVIRLAGLDDELICCEEYGLKSIRADIWIIRKKGIPIGVVEIKRPHTHPCDSNIIDNEKVLGQLYDYMKRLESFFGISHVFGILTNYEDWRICWFANESATSDQLLTKDVQISRPKGLPDNPSMIGCELENLSAIEIKSPVKSEKRTFFSANVINRNDQSLIKTLTSLILKMYYSPVTPVELFHRQRSYIQLSESSWSWVGISPQVHELDFKRFPNLNSSKFLLLADLRGGADGMACLLNSRKSLCYQIL